MLVDNLDALQSRLWQQLEEWRQADKRTGHDVTVEVEAQKRKVAKFCAFARVVASFKDLSTCRNPAGAVIVPLDYSRILSIGYSGPARCIPNDQCRVSMQPAAKRGWRDCFCPTAITNALMAAPLIKSRSAFMVCTMAPTQHEAGLVLNHGGIGWLFFEQSKTLMKTKESEHLDGTSTLREWIHVSSLHEMNIDHLQQMDTRSRGVFKRD